MISIGYHYIRNQKEDSEAIKPFDINTFKNQLDYLNTNYYLPTIQEFFEHSKQKKPFPASWFLLTFDDGLKDHFLNVFPILKKKKMWGIFFVPTKPLVENAFLCTFFNHYFIEKFGSEEAFNIVNKIIESNRPKFNQYNFDALIKNFSLNKVLFLKKLFNSKSIFESESDKDYFIKLVHNNYYKELNVNDIHLNSDEIKQMSNGGMLIGSHTITHNYMSDLSTVEQDKEIKNSFDVLEKITNNKTLRVFAYPYGKKFTYNSHSLNALSKNKVDIAFSYNDDNKLMRNTSNWHYLLNRENPEYFFKLI